MIEPAALLSRLATVLQTPRSDGPGAVAPVAHPGAEHGDTHAPIGTAPAPRPGPTDRADISPEARAAAHARASVSSAEQELSTDEQTEVADLKRRDQEVRAHEQAHQATGGQYAGAASYSYTTGPDGQRYATGGSVPIDTAPVTGDPQATVAKMRQVRAAALAPANPSAADRQVAARAARELAKAQAELNSTDSTEGNTGATGAGTTSGHGASVSNPKATGESEAPRLDTYA